MEGSVDTTTYIYNVIFVTTEKVVWPPKLDTLLATYSNGVPGGVEAIPFLLVDASVNAETCLKKQLIGIKEK